MEETPAVTATVAAVATAAPAVATTATVVTATVAVPTALERPPMNLSLGGDLSANPALRSRMDSLLKEVTASPKYLLLLWS